MTVTERAILGNNWVFNQGETVSLEVHGQGLTKPVNNVDYGLSSDRFMLVDRDGRWVLGGILGVWVIGWCLGCVCCVILFG